MTASAHANRPPSEPSLDSDDIRTNPSTEPTLAELIERRFSRRDLLDDNCALDPRGRLWVATDQGRTWSKTSGGADGTKDDGGEIGS